jgi:Werner syndrome ATP-dependent helicase
LQLDIIKNAVEANKDQLVVMATGKGKSLCYQFPSIYRNDLTIVVSPLIALMEVIILILIANSFYQLIFTYFLKDQVMALK